MKIQNAFRLGLFGGLGVLVAVVIGSGIASLATILTYVGAALFLALGVEPTGRFLHDIRRVSTEADFFRVCAEHLDHSEQMPLEPFPVVLQENDVLAGEHA